MFEMIGTMSSYLQQYRLKKSATQKLRTGEAFDWRNGGKSSAEKVGEMKRGAARSIVELSLEKAKEEDKLAEETRKGSIRQKLRQGRKLSANELEYLKRHDEELYKKAKTVMDEREKLERALKHAKSKAEAHRAVAIASANAAAAYSGDMDGKGGGAAGGIGGTSAGGEAVASVGGEAAAGAMHIDAGGAENVSVEVASAEPGGVDAARGAGAAEGGNATDAARTAEAAGPKDGQSGAFPATEGQSGGFDEPLVLLVLRHLQAEWQDFRKTEDYDELPEDELMAARRHEFWKDRAGTHQVRAVSLTAVAAAYQNAMHDGAVLRTFGGAAR